MNKIYSKIMSILLVLVAAFSLTACSEIENGVKIQRAKMTLTFYNEDGNAEDYDVYLKFYVNYAPETIEHVKGLIENKYYDGLDVTNLTKTYFQFGDYTINNEGNLVAKDQGATINGEFEKAGWKGNKLSVSSGAILLKRDAESKDGGSKFNTGKATLAVCLTSSAPFDVAEYCVFGKVISDDGDKNADEGSKEHMSSLDRLLKISDQLTDKIGRKLYYCVKDEDEAHKTEDGKFSWQGKYVTYAGIEDENHYFNGNYTSKQVSGGQAERLTEEEEKDVKAKIEKNPEDFMCIPTLKVVVKSFELVK